PDDVVYSGFLPGTGLMTYVFPQGKGRVRSYVGSQNDASIERFQGDGDVPRFIETEIRSGVPKEWYAGARTAGPLATFDGTDEWVPHPYRDGVALIGDAASTSDPRRTRLNGRARRLHAHRTTAGPDDRQWGARAAAGNALRPPVRVPSPRPD